ncbi:MAG: carbohydrate-binding protein [Bacteroidota bacterium]
MQTPKILLSSLFAMLFLTGVAWAQPSIQITTPSQVATNTYVRVEGTASGVTKPMWYEVFQGTAAGKMTDFGAFKQGANWFFIARKLSGGANVVKVYGANAANQISSSTITLTIDDAWYKNDLVLRPRPNPAEIWWGGLGNNAQLQQNPDQWNMVKKYADGYFLHASAWGTENNGLMQSLIQQTSPYGTKYVAELGGGTGTDAGWPQWQHIAWGAGADGWIINRYNSNGLILSEATHDFQPNWQPFAEAFPSLNEAQCVDKMTNQWMEYFAKDNVVFPHLKRALTQSPVWWRWRNFPSLNPSTEVDDFVANGRQYRFDMSMVMENMTAKSNAINQQWAFFSDFPYYTMVWGEDPATTNGNTGTLGWTAREKQRNYELFLHANKARHTAVLNEDPGGALMDSNPAEWNRQFSERSMKSFYLQQREGHRPGRFVFESWYFGGTPARAFPTAVTPESDPNSYTGLAKMGIKYLKGIKDENGTLETLQLTKSTYAYTTTFTLKNTGDVACMPALAAIINGDARFVTMQWLDANNVDISEAVTSAEGWVYTPLLQPNATVSIRCVVGGSVNPGTYKQIMLEAFWNPQDPTGIIRDRQSISLYSSTFRSPYAGIIPIPGVVEAENFDNGSEGISYHDTTPTNLIGPFRSYFPVDTEPCSEGGNNIAFSDNGEWLDYSVKVAATGNYTFNARVSSPFSNGRFHIEMDGTNITGAVAVPNTGGWQNWQTVSKTVNLTAGQHIMHFVIDAKEFNTNKFTFIAQADIQTPFPGPNPTAIPGIIELENFDNGGESVGYHDYEEANLGGEYRPAGPDIVTCSEGGYALNNIYNDEWLEYTVNAVASGSYTINARVTSWSDIGTFHLEWDGVDISGNIAVPKTGDWETWQSAWHSVIKTVTLTAGQHRLRIVADGGYFNFNKITFSQNFTPDPGFSGVYRLVNRQSGKVLDVNGCSLDNGMKVQQWTWLGGNCQRWKITATDNGYYKLTAQHSGQALEIGSALATDGAKANQWPSNDCACQQWKVEATSGGFYKLTARHSTQVLEVGNALMNDGAQVNQYPWNMAACQQWAIEPVAAFARQGVEEEVANASLKLSPNPADEAVNLAWEGLGEEEAVLTLVNAQGTIVYRQAVKGGLHQLSTSVLTNGLYICSLQSSKVIITKKLVVKH